MSQFGILAFPASHSLSPAMFAAAFAAQNLVHTYSRFEVSPAELEKFWAEKVRTREVAGLSVSLPHKIVVANLVDALTPAAERIGAVNTVFWRDEKLIGDNTDWQGFLTPLAEVIDLKDQKVVVLGAGGAARAAVFALLSAGAAVAIFARRLSEAEKLAADFGVAAGEWGALASFAPAVIVNTTPLGLAGEFANESPLPADFFSHVKPQLVYDLIYNPAETPLLAAARAAGVATLGGLPMLVAQGARQFEIWTGELAPRAVMLAAAEAALIKKIV